MREMKEKKWKGKERKGNNQRSSLLASFVFFFGPSGERESGRIDFHSRKEKEKANN